MKLPVFYVFFVRQVHENLHENLHLSPANMKQRSASRIKIKYCKLGQNHRTMQFIRFIHCPLLSEFAAAD